MKKIISLILALAMLFTLTACGNGAAEETQAAAPVDPNNPYAEHISTSASSYAYSAELNDPLYDYVCEKYNIDITHYQMTFTDWAEKTRLWIASGDMPDSTWWQFPDGTGYSEYKNYVNQGLLKALPDDWESRWPNLAGSVEATGLKDAIEIDGKTYMIPIAEFKNFSPVETNYWHYMFYYRTDYAKELGLDFSDGVITLEELKEYAAGCKEKYGTIGISGNTITIPHMIVEMCNSSFDKFYEKNGEFVWGPGEESTLEGIKLLKELYDGGYIDTDYYARGDYDYDDLWASGTTCGVLGDGTPSNVASRVSNLGKQNPDLNAEECLGVALILGPDGQYHEQAKANYWSARIFNPEISDAALIRWLDIMDWMATEDGQFFATMGIEGVDWERDADGNFISHLPKDENGNTVDINSHYTSSMLWAQQAILMNDFTFVTPNISEKCRNACIDLMLKREEYDKADPDNISHWDYRVELHSSDAKNAYTVTFTDKINELVCTPGINVEEEWRAWVNSMQGIVQPILDELNAAY